MVSDALEKELDQYEMPAGYYLVMSGENETITKAMNQLRSEGMEKREAILTAGKTRLRPVLMTALTTILALCTMVFSNDMGSEMAKPMSIVTIGGLVYGTLLTLIVIPCIYDIFTREKKEKQED